MLSLFIFHVCVYAGKDTMCTEPGTMYEGIDIRDQNHGDERW